MIQSEYREENKSSSFIADIGLYQGINSQLQIIEKISIIF